jgi:hypothetical protein
MKGNKGSARLDVFTCCSFLERSRQPSRRLTFEMKLAVTSPGSPHTYSSHATFSSLRFDLHAQFCTFDQSLPSETPCTWSAGQIHSLRSIRNHSNKSATANTMTSPDNASLSREQPHQSQQANPDTSTLSTAHTEPQIFEATTAVLDTNELLHLIISAIPREYRTSLRRVSKNWQAAVLKIGHVFEPFDYDWYFPDTDLSRSTGPIYSMEKNFIVKHNPVFFVTGRCVNQMEDSDDQRYHASIEHHLSFADVAERKNEFITIPPLSQALMSADVPGAEQFASLRVRTGIQVGDLVEHYRKMKSFDNDQMFRTFRSVSFAVRIYYDWSDCESMDSPTMLGGGGEEDDHGEAEGGNGGVDRDGEVQAV